MCMRVPLNFKERKKKMKMNLFLVVDGRLITDESVIEAKKRMEHDFPDDNIIVIESEEELNGTLLGKTLFNTEEQIFTIGKVESWMYSEADQEKRKLLDVSWRLDQANRLMNSITNQDNAAAKKERLINIVPEEDCCDESDDFFDEPEEVINKKKKRGIGILSQIVKKIFKT